MTLTTHYWKVISYTLTKHNISHTNHPQKPAQSPSIHIAHHNGIGIGIGIYFHESLHIYYHTSDDYGYRILPYNHPDLTSIILDIIKTHIT